MANATFIFEENHDLSTKRKKYSQKIKAYIFILPDADSALNSAFCPYARR